jgi:hypothetical protein
MRIFRRRHDPSGHADVRPFPPELLAEAMSQPGGWVYEIDARFARDGVDGAVPPEGIKGAWKIGLHGVPTGEYQANDNYHA